MVSIPADPSIKNFSFALVGEDIYYRENSVMNKMELPIVTGERVRGMVAIRDATNRLLERQLEECSDEEVASLQAELNRVYDSFTAKYGLLSSNANKRAFSMDSSYCLLTSLEFLDEKGELKRKADIFTKRTIRRAEPVTSVDTASEALAVSIGEKGKSRYSLYDAAYRENRRRGHRGAYRRYLQRIRLRINGSHPTSIFPGMSGRS